MNSHPAVNCVTDHSQWNTYWSSVAMALWPELGFTDLTACRIYLQTLIPVSLQIFTKQYKFTTNCRLTQSLTHSFTWTLVHQTWGWPLCLSQWTFMIEHASPTNSFYMIPTLPLVDLHNSGGLQGYYLLDNISHSCLLGFCLCEREVNLICLSRHLLVLLIIEESQQSISVLFLKCCVYSIHPLLLCADHV